VGDTEDNATITAVATEADLSVKKPATIVPGALRTEQEAHLAALEKIEKAAHKRVNFRQGPKPLKRDGY